MHAVRRRQITPEVFFLALHEACRQGARISPSLVQLIADAVARDGAEVVIGSSRSCKR